MEIEQQVVSVLTGLIEKAPWLALVLLIVGTARVSFKPALDLFKVIAKQTPTEKDDAFLEKVETSSITKGVLWFADLLLSIKNPVKK